MNQSLSTYLVTPFGNTLTAVFDAVCAQAQDVANRNGAPCGIWRRDEWYTVCEIAPEEIEPNPEDSGWRLDAIVEPSDWE